MTETPAQQLRRRLLTVPAVMVATVVVTATLPALLLLALFIDLVRGEKTFSTTRLTGVLFCVLFIESFSLLLLAWTWLSTPARSRARAARTFVFQRWYTAALLRTVTRLFSLQFVVHGAEVVAPGPLLVFLRHASLVDVLLPAGFISNVHQIELRYVIKRENLKGPCIDIAGHWTPNSFVDRSGKHTAEELAALHELKAGIDQFEGVIIYPEGTRFSQRKREALLAHLEGPARETARKLRHLLPIRPGGAMTLLVTEPLCDVLFVGHHGLEGLTKIGDILRGGMVGRTVTIHFWREKAENIPRGDEARLQWANEHWQRMDDWLETFG